MMLKRTIIGLSIGILLMTFGLANMLFYNFQFIGFIVTLIGGIIILITLYFEPGEENNDKQNKSNPQE